jgi:hypothetical protein
MDLRKYLNSLPGFYAKAVVSVSRAFDRFLWWIGFWQFNFQIQSFVSAMIVLVVLGLMIVPLGAILWRLIRDGERPSAAEVVAILLIEGAGSVVLPLALALLRAVLYQHPGPLI